MSDTLLRVEDLKIYYPVAGSGFGKKEFVKAVDGVTFEVKKGEVFGIVGESGCGKSTLGRGVCKLENLTSGHVYLDGEDITEYNDRRMRSIRKKVQMVFQDPYASLNPRMSVFDIIAEPLLVHHLYQDKADLEKKVLDLLHRVGLDDYHANRYPHEFSGGQRQRIGIARALAVEPSLIIADEPVSALDVSIQAQVLNLLNELKHDLDLTYIFVAHDLSVVEYISDRVGVMYLGNFVEVGEKEKIYSNPMHPIYAGTAFRSSGSGSDGKKKKEFCLREASHPPTSRRQAANSIPDVQNAWNAAKHRRRSGMKWMTDITYIVIFMIKKEGNSRNEAFYQCRYRGLCRSGTDR